MTLPVPRLDDRRFQDLVDEAKTQIPRYCPEWTDHNVSDPGVALIELFAWMTEMLLYRVNQVPDKLYVKFLELLGIHLEPARAARVPVTFYLSAPQEVDVTIPEGTEVATVRTETTRAIVFTTEANLQVRVPSLQAVLTGGTDNRDWIAHDIRRLEFPEHAIAAFSDTPVPGDALYLVLERDHSHHVMAVRMSCAIAAGAGVDPADPPLSWQAWSGDGGWVPCDIEYDGTRALNVPGELVLHTPTMVEGVMAGRRGYWLRCVVTPARPGQKTYYKPPMLSQLRVQARGGTTYARHATTVVNEVLGRSDGTPGQTFKLLNDSLLARDPRRDFIVAELPGESGGSQEWREVADFADSSEQDLHYTLDGQTGEITFGPSLLQPDGGVYRFGAVPAKGARLIMRRYQCGGGIIGNAPRGALSVLKTSIPYVARVNNRQPAVGGRDPETLDHAKLQAPKKLRSRTRAVTAEDYELLARDVHGVARTYCLTPGAQPAGPHDPKPGQVVVLVLPAVDDPSVPLMPEQLALPPELNAEVFARLNEQRLIGTTLEVRAPRYLWVAVGITLRLAPRTDPAAMEAARKAGEEALYGYLNPYTGGPHGTGWPIGRDLHRSELFGLLQQIPNVEYADGLRVTVAETGRAVPSVTASQHLVVPFDALVCSGRHQVRVDYARDEG